MHALGKVVKGRTVVMISHRLSTLGNVDDIIVMKDGRIVEQGTFRELKKKGGVFAGLLEEQNRYNSDRAGNESILRSAFVPIAAQGPAYQLQQPPVAPNQWSAAQAQFPPVPPATPWQQAPQSVPPQHPQPATGSANNAEDLMQATPPR